MVYLEIHNIIDPGGGGGGGGGEGGVAVEPRMGGLGLGLLFLPPL